MQVCVCHHLARNNWSCSCNSNLAGQLSGWGDDHRSEAKVGRLLQVGEQREAESQSLPRSCGCTGQQLPTLIHESDAQKIFTKPPSVRRSPKTASVCPYSHASWAVSPAFALASGSSAQHLGGSGWHAGWGDTQTAAPQMCTRGRVCRSRARLSGVENECDSPKSK